MVIVFFAKIIYDIFEVIKMFFNDCNLEPTKALKQIWKEDAFSYMNTPRPDNGIMFISSGKIDFITESHILPAKTGDIVFLPMNSHYEVHFYTEHNAVKNYLVNFTSDKKVYDTSLPIKIAEKAEAHCKEAFRNYVKESLNPELSVFRSKGRLYLLLDTVMQCTNNLKSRQTLLLEEAKNYLQKNLDCPISEVAKRYAMSESGFRKLFRDTFGMSPIQYRTEAKLARATYLLDSTDMSVSEISDSLGFYDVAYFCKCFHSYTGMTPKQYVQSRVI